MPIYTSSTQMSSSPKLEKGYYIREREGEREIPVIDFNKLESENRGEARNVRNEQFFIFFGNEICLYIVKNHYDIFDKADWTILAIINKEKEVKIFLVLS